MAKKPKEPEKETSERWLVTYADLMNLLLILFIILYSMSQVDKEKAERVAESIRAGFGYVQNGGTGEASGEGSGLNLVDFTTPGTLEDGSNGAQNADSASAASDSQSSYWSEEQRSSFENFYNEITKLIQQNNLQDLVDAKLDDTGVIISFKDNVLFNSGQADLGNNSLQLINTIGNLLKNVKFSYILVEGHTDSDPIHTAQYTDNMDLSTQRAANVWRTLVTAGLDPTAMASIGYGEFKPLVPNTSLENKAKNRRVVITIMRNKITAASLISKTGTETPVASPSSAG